MIKFNNFLHLLPFLLFLSCCTDDSGGTDPCKDCFKNEFKCKINGVDWSTYCEPDPLFGYKSIIIEYYNVDKYLGIIAVNDNLNNGMHLAIRNVDLYNRSWQRLRYYNDIYSDHNKNSGCKLFELDTFNTENFKILQLNETERILDAEFKFKCYSNCLDTIQINSGILKIKY